MNCCSTVPCIVQFPIKWNWTESFSECHHALITSIFICMETFFFLHDCICHCHAFHHAFHRRYMSLLICEPGMKPLPYVYIEQRLLVLKGLRRYNAVESLEAILSPWHRHFEIRWHQKSIPLYKNVGDGKMTVVIPLRWLSSSD